MHANPNQIGYVPTFTYVDLTYEFQAFTPPQARTRPESPVDADVDGDPLIIRQTMPMKLWGGESFEGTVSSRVYGRDASGSSERRDVREEKEDLTMGNKKIASADKKRIIADAPKSSNISPPKEKRPAVVPEKAEDRNLGADNEKRLSQLLKDAERTMAKPLEKIEEERLQMKREQAQLQKKLLEAEKIRAKELGLLEKRLSEEMSQAKQKQRREKEIEDAERTRLIKQRIEERLAEEKAKARQKLKEEATQLELERAQARAEEESFWIAEQQSIFDRQLAEERTKAKIELSKTKQMLQDQHEEAESMRAKALADAKWDQAKEATRLEELNQLVEERLQFRIDELMAERQKQETSMSASDLLPQQPTEESQDDTDSKSETERTDNSDTKLSSPSDPSTADALAIDPQDLDLVQMCQPAEFDPASPIFSSKDSNVDVETCLLPTEYPFVSLLRDSSPYIVNHRDSTIVYHIPGELISDVARINSVIDDIALTWLFGMRIVICVGCRNQVLTRLERKYGSSTNNGNDFGLSSKLGVRVTDTEKLRIIEEEAGFCRFEVERLLNRCLKHKGADCNVVSGAFVTAKEFGIVDGVDYQNAGYPVTLQTDRIAKFHSRNDVVLLTPLGFTKEGDAINIHSEAMAAFTAGALKASKLVYISSSPMILRGSTDGHQRIQMIQRSNAMKILSHHGLDVHTKTGFPRWRENLYMGDDLDKDQQAMLLKMGWSTYALDRGVERAHIIDCEDGALLDELFTARRGYGTCISHDDYEAPHKDDTNDDLSVADGLLSAAGEI